MQAPPRAIRHVNRLVPVSILSALLLLSGACDGSRTPAAPSTSNPSNPTPSFTVTSITDGDTLRVSPAANGTTTVRLVGIDAPEVGGNTQEPWASTSREQLASLVPAGTTVRLITDRQPTDSYGRLLARMIRVADGLDANREQLRQGQAVTYLLWPNVAEADRDRAAQIEAQDAGRGIWNAAAPLRELPFEYRLRTSGEQPTRPTGDRLTQYYVDGANYRLVHVNNRLFFSNDAEAQSAGYRPCPRSVAGTYDPLCFGSGR